MNIRKGLLVAAVTAAMALGAPAKADFLIDDFGALPPGQGTDPDTGESWSYRAIDETVVAAPKYDGGTFQNNMMVFSGQVDNANGWSREISSALVAGDSVQTEICYNCQAAHIVADAGVVPSEGTYEFEWTGPSVDLSGESLFQFDWSSDLDGTTWSVEFIDDQGNKAESEENGGLDGGFVVRQVSIPLPEFVVTDDTGQLYGDITRISLKFIGVPAIDGNIDNVRLVSVPEPATLALMGLGLAGLSWRQRRRRAR